MLCYVRCSCKKSRNIVILFMNFLFFTQAKTINGNNDCGGLSGCVAERQPGEHYVVSINV